MEARPDPSLGATVKRVLRPPARHLAERLKRLAAPEDAAPEAPPVQGFVFDRSDQAHGGLAPDGLPIPPRELWRSAAETFEEFTEFGDTAFATMKRLLADAGFGLTATSRILDFGSGSGRFVRMWGKEAGEVWGCDLNADQIRWCQTFLTPPYRFVTSTTFASLPFEDRTFDLVYAGSVFTHIPERADMWLLEIRRILRPGGFFFVTISDELLWDAVKRGEFALLEPYMEMHPAGASDGLPADFVVLGEGAASNVFYRRDYFAWMAGRDFDVRSVTPEARGYQAAFVLQRPSD